MKPYIVAIIPARGGSKGIRFKNLVDFCGRPLIFWTIKQALASRFICEVFVTSDNDRILRYSQSVGAFAIKRPKKISCDSATSESALEHAISYIQKKSGKKPDVVIFLQATSPLRDSKDIDRAVELFISNRADSLFSASILEDYCIWQALNHKLNSLTYNYKNRVRRQAREPVFLENGSIYIFKPEILFKFNNRLGGKIIFFPMPFWKSYEIDKTDDLVICEYFMKKNNLAFLSKFKRRG